MPLEFIPNQPIIFEHPIGDYPCLNNDPKSYGQLLQDGDELCIQWKLSPCNEPLCEPDMVMDPVGTDELGGWTVNGGWTSASSSTLDYAGPDLLPQIAGQPLNLTIGAAYLFTGQVDAYTGGKDYSIILGTSVIPIGNIPQSGQFSIGFTAYETPITLAIITDPSTTAGDTLQLSNLLVKQYTTCWEDDLNGGLSSWSYSFDGANGKFCSLDPTGGDLINTNAISAPGTYHGVKLTITDCTQGGITVTLGSALMGSQTSGNGQFTFYGVPTAGVDMVISKVDNFDGCISQVEVFDYGDIDSYEVHFETDDGNTFSDDYSVVAFEDRIVWCDLLSNLTWTVDGLPDGALTCKLLKTFIYDPCDATEYESVNYINYKNDGWECTKLVEAWSDGYAFGFYFGDINNPDFKLRQRLRFLAFNPVYRNAGEEYLYSSGATGRSFAQSQKARTAWFDYMDEYAHDCTRTQLLNQKLFIDNYAFYYPTEDYEPEWNERGAYNLAQSRVTVFHEEAIFGTTCGTMANAVCPPQIVPTPAEFTQVLCNVEYDSSAKAFDYTKTRFESWIYDSAGLFQSINTANYNLNVAGDRTAMAALICSEIDSIHGTTSSGTITIAGAVIVINISGTGTITAPMSGISFVMIDTSAVNKIISFSITFA